MKPRRLVFAGTPEFAVPALDALLHAGHEVAAVFTQPDRPAGRGRRLAPPPVKRRALAAGVPVHQPRSLKDSDSQALLRGLAPELMVVVAYGLLLPRAVLDIPPRGCLNIHASLLPRWRGAAPIQRAILAGDQQTGISIMQMDEGLDTGPVLLKKKLPIGPEDTAATLHERLARLGGEAIVEALARLEELEPVPQFDGHASYAPKLDKAEARIDWSRPAARLAREVRAFNPWPVSHTLLDGGLLRVWAARPAGPGRPGAAPGTILAAGPEGLRVATGGDGSLLLTRLQRAGGRPVSAAEFLRGQPLRPGSRLG